MSNHPLKTIGLTAVACVATLLAGAALGGEITGNDKSLKQADGTLHGKSACAFSGLNDTYSGDPEVPDHDGLFRTQNWGSFPRAVRLFLTMIGAHPGSACNPAKGGGEPE
jgi:hypothetical protein